MECVAHTEGAHLGCVVYKHVGNDSINEAGEENHKRR